MAGARIIAPHDPLAQDALLRERAHLGTPWKGGTTVTEPSDRPGSPFAAWNWLSPQSRQEDTTSRAEGDHPQQAGADAWIPLIEQLWRANPYSTLVPLDAAAIARTFQQLWAEAAKNPGRLWATYEEFVQQYTRLMTTTALRFWGQEPQAEPVIQPEAGDKRFSAPEWQQNPVFDALKQGYLLFSTTLLKLASEVEGLEEQQQRKLLFYLRQFLDAISPTNSPFTNPEVIRETMQTGGRNLLQGMEHLLRDLKAGQMKMTDTDAFAPGRNLALTPGQVVYRNRLIELIQYAPMTEQVFTLPLLFLPPWINKYYVLDLQPHNSLIRFLVEAGFTVFMISWKNPDAAMEATTFEDYLTFGPLAALAVIKEITGAPRVNAVGYCIGGTLLAMTLAYLAARKQKMIPAATFLVSLQDFREVGETSVFIDEPQVSYIEGQMMERGYLESRSMATMFNLLRANDLIWSNVINSYWLGKEPPAFDLLYWNADGTRMARAAHAFYLRNTYLENNLIQPRRITLCGVPLDLGQIRQEVYAVGAEQDHIVPWRSAWRITQLTSGAVRFVLAGSGHIAGIINPPSKGKGYWTNEQSVESAEQWFAGAERHSGSWWTDWLAWLEPRSGKPGAPPPMGSAAHPALSPAPGLYVLER
jgi:polyhydroxyalkanoate synthase